VTTVHTRFFVCLAVALLPSSFGAAAATATDKPLAFGDADIPSFSRQLVNQTSPRTVQLILSAIETSSSTPRRLELISDLGACQSSTAVKLLCDLLHDSSPLVRAQAARSLGEIRDPAAIPSLRNAYHDSDPLIRREAIDAGEELGDLEATQVGLKDSDEAVVLAACTYVGNSQSVSLLCDSIQSLSTWARVAALESFAIKPPEHGKWREIAACLIGSVSERFAALRALAAMGVADSASTITPCLKDGSSVVRREAVLALGRTASGSERQAVAIRMLDDPDLAVRSAAAELIASDPTDQAVRPLVDQLPKGNQTLRDASRKALIAIGPASIPAAEKLLADANDERKADGSYILGALRSQADSKEQIALLNSHNWQLARVAAKSLDEIGDRSSGPALAAVAAKYSSLQNASGPEAESAFAAIGASIISAAHLGYAPLVAIVQPMVDQKDCDADVRDAAIYAMGLLGSASDSVTCNKMLAVALDRLEAIPTRMEAVKALGQLRFQPADATFADMAQTQGNLQMRWLAHWAHDRVAGKSTPFEAPPLNWSADVAISDLGEPSGEQQISGTLGFDGSFLAGAWTPVHLTIRNGSQNEINGSANFAVASGGRNAVVRVPCNVPRQSSVKLTAYGYFQQEKRGADNVATTSDWMTADGGRIARAPIAASALSARDGFSLQSAHSLDTLILCLVDPTDSAGSGGEQAASDLASAISERSGFAVKSQRLAIAEAPRQAVGYDSCRVVLLQADPEKLDIAQRQALLDHVRMGGELLVCGRQISPATWLSQYLPVIPLGRREVSEIGNAGDRAQYTLTGPSTLVEGADVRGGDARVLVADSDLIHIADRRLGLGFIVFTSFLPNALDGQDQASAAMWKTLLLLSDKSAGTLPRSAAEPLGQLVGTPTAPLSVPIAIVGVYLATLFVSQRFFSGDSRPRAFALSVGIAVVGFISLVAISAVRMGRAELNGGRITLLSLGPSGGGQQADLLAFAGANNPSLRLTARDDAVIRPVTSSEPEEVEIQQLPFEVARAHVHAAEVTQVWSTQRPVDSKCVVKAFANFGPSGLTVSVSNDLNMPFHDPVLVWGAPWSLPDIQAGSSSLFPRQRDAAGEFIGGAGVHSDVDLLRSKIIQEFLSAKRTTLIRDDDEPLLLGWADELPASAQVSDARMKSLSMVCTPVVISPSEPGTTVRIDGAFCRIIPGPGAAPPYDQVRRQWVSSNQAGDWIIGFAPPTQIGVVRPDHVILNADMSAPTQTITIVRGFCDGAGAKASAPGQEVARWKQPIGSESVGFDCTPSDFDAQGRVWIRVHVESSLPTPSPWFFRKMELSYVAEVIGNPAHSTGTINRE
jgi:HEAT repeat protein